MRPSLHLFSLALPICAWCEMTNRSAPPAITVYTQFEHSSSASSLETMREELDTIMGPLGLSFTWRDLQASTGSEVSVELVVVTFKGSCEIGAPIPAGTQTGALGWTHMSDGAILPFSDLDCDKIRRMISPEIRWLDRGEQEVAFGR